MSNREFDHDLLYRYLMEVQGFPHRVILETIENLRLDGDGLIFDKVLRNCDEWHTQMKREAMGNE